MAVFNGQPVNQSITNAAFLSRTQNSDTIGVITLNNTTDVNSGPSISNLQRAVNEIVETLGNAANVGDANRLIYATNYWLADTQSHKENLENLDSAFHGTTGHNHDGSNGGGPQISAVNLVDINQLQAFYQVFEHVGASGLSTDVSASFGGATSGGDANTAGVLTDPPFNRVSIVETTGGGEVEDGSGRRVYGRLTESAGTWTLSYYVDIAGVETAYNLPSTDITVYYREVFTLATRPTIPADLGGADSINVVGDIPDATISQPGKVSIGVQTFGGGKSLQDYFATQKLDVATAATIPALATSKSIVRFTGATVTSLQGATAGVDGQHLTIHNASTAVVTVQHEDAGAAAADRFDLPADTAIAIEPDQSAEFFYDVTDSRWKQKSGSGSGAGASANQDRNIALIGGGQVNIVSIDDQLDVDTRNDGIASYLGIQFNNTTWKTQSYTPTQDGVLAKTIVSMSSIAGATGTLRVDLYSNVAGQPNTLIAQSQAFDASTLTGSFADQEFTYATAPVLSAGTVYWLVIRGVSLTADCDVEIGNVDTYPAHSSQTSNDSGVSWGSATPADIDVEFYLDINGFSFSSDAYIQVPGLPDARNTILADTYFVADGFVSYVDINRTGIAPSNLTVSSVEVDSFVEDDDRVVIARRIGSNVYVGVSGEIGPASGGGQLSGDTTTVQNVSDGNPIVLDPNAKRQYLKIQSDTAATDVQTSSVAFSGASLSDRSEVVIIGNDDTRRVKIRHNDLNNNGAIVNGEVFLGKYDSITFVYDATFQRFVEINRSVK